MPDLKLVKGLDPELGLDPQIGLQLPEAELEPAPELTELADEESLTHLALVLEPGPYPEIVMLGLASIKQCCIQCYKVVLYESLHTCRCYDLLLETYPYYDSRSQQYRKK